MEESELRSRASGALKTSQKGRSSKKKPKALSAEEDARRREAVKEALREKLELEKRAVQVVERLLEDSVPEDFLIECARFITCDNYKDTVEERSIAKLCGFPICPKKVGKIPTQRYKICTKTNKVYDITERKLYCSNFCYKASKHFELQISKTPLWLRKSESTPEITLMTKGDSGSSGEEVKLSDRQLQKEDIENPSSTLTQYSHDAGLRNEDLDQSEDSDKEQEFVSSVLSKRTGPRVHWGDLPTCNDEETKTQNIEKEEEKLGKEDGKEEVNGMENALDEATTQLNLCSLSENNKDAKVDSILDNSFSTERAQNTDYTRNSVRITHVGMSKKGAAGLRNLLKQHKTNPNSVRHNLLERLKITLKEWSTDETLSFLYGAEDSVGKPFEEVRDGVEEEELDEDDIEEEGGGGGDGRPTGAAPDYGTLKKEAQQMELRVKEFYKGTWVHDEKEGQEKSTDHPVQKPVLPLDDSKAQHLIQKKITVEKLTSCLINIIGPLGLTMNDISTHLNNLIRTFRFTNTNIIHKAPEWTFIAVVLLHLLSEVSPLIGESLKQPSSVKYLSTLMEELGLKKEDLLSLVQMFKTTTN